MNNSNIFAVAGNSILHSMSPLMQNALFKSCMVNGIYTRIAASSAKEALETASQIGMKGFNVTAPFKEEIIQHLDCTSPNAKKIGAVNTVVNKNRKWVGYNTDYIGVANALIKNGIALKGKNALVLGAGGAGTAAAFGLMKAGASVVIINRTVEKARTVADRLGCRSAPFIALAKELKVADVLVSAVSTRERIVSPGLLREGLAVMDANYHNSVLSEDAAKAGCKVVSGLEWLLYQALPAFKLFTGKKGNANVVRKALKSAKSARKPNIAIIGFMGVGKSTVGKELAKILGMEFADTDKLIEQGAGMPIPEIFSKKGEAAFRKMERELVESAIVHASRKIFSCGGGIVLDAGNRKTLSENALVVWLWASPEIAVERATKEGNRPLLEGAKDKVAKIQELLAQRIPLYAETSDMIISTSGRTQEKIAERLMHEIHNAFGN